MSRPNRRRAHKDATRTRDHILPKAMLGDDDPSNLRPSCHRCNQLRAECGHCIGALACARAVARSQGRDVRQVIKDWRYRFRVRPDGVWFGSRSMSPHATAREEAA
jgi:hypothetical protein